MQPHGIPENWLSLVSNTTRLANTLEAQGDDGLSTEKSVGQHRKQLLEDAIISVATADCSSGTTQNLPDEELSRSSPNPFAEMRVPMLQALNFALVIFFYRRVSNIDPWTLYDHVAKVIEALRTFDTCCRHYNIECRGSPWPGFVAGCEAMSFEHRDFFKSWFDENIRLTGFARLVTARDCMLQVWARRDRDMQNSGGQRRVVSSWVNICREQELHVMLA